MIAGEPKKTVSILLTNYNHRKYLSDSLAGICGQTRQADEIIIVDDGSTDGSLEVIRSFAAEYTNIQILVNKENKGVQYSIARALAAATSDFIVWAAADDKLLPEFLSENMAALEENPTSCLSFSRLATFSDEAETLNVFDETSNGVAFDLGDRPQFLDSKTLLERLDQSYLWLSGNTAVVSTEAIKEIGGFLPDLKWHSDWFSFYAIALRYGACTIPKPLAAMRVLPATYSSVGMRDPDEQLAVLRNLTNVLARAEFADLRIRFRQRPCLFSVFGTEMLKALRAKPRDLDLYIRYLAWHMVHSGSILLTRSRRHSKIKYIEFCAGLAQSLTGKLLHSIVPRTWRTPS